jgi:hypothetical protein
MGRKNVALRGEFLAVLALTAGVGGVGAMAVPQGTPPAPAAPNAPSAPPTSPPSSPSTPKAPASPPAAAPAPPPTVEPETPPPSDREHAVDEELMKDALKRVTQLYEREAKKFTEANRAKAKAAYDVAKAKWDAGRKQRNDDTGTDRKRDEEQEKRRSGEKAPPAPKMPDFVDWGEQMKAEVRAERDRDPESGKKERLLISDNHQLNCKPIQDFIKKYRNVISDARIKALLRQAFEEYERRWMVKMGLASDQDVIEP